MYEAARCFSCDVCYPVTNYTVDSNRCTYCGRCVENCVRGAISVGYSYKISEAHRKEAEEAAAKRDRLYGYIIGFLVLGLGLAIVAVIIGRLVTSLQ
jgi:ferredoxin